VSPLGGDTSGAGAEQDPPDAPRGSVDVGNYVLEVGGSGGTLIQRRAGPAREGTGPLERTLEAKPKVEEGAAAAAAGVVDDASEVTAKIERAVALGKGVAEGKVLSPDQLALEVGALLGLLERLDRRGRCKEALLLARALVNLLMLLKRWAELLRALRVALRAGEKLGDLKAVGWVKHELGTLRIVAGDVEGAEQALHGAREIRERIGDRRGLAASNRNLQVLCERLREMLRKEELVRAKGRPPSGLRLISLAVLFALLFGGGAAAGVIASDSNDPGDSTAVDGVGPDSNKTIDTDDDATNGTDGGADTFPLVVTIAGDGGGTVEIEGVVCGEPTCEEDVPAGETVTLVALSNPRSDFEGFSGDCSGTDVCALEMTEAKSVTAIFGQTAQPSRAIEEEGEEDEEPSEEELPEEELPEEEPEASPVPSEALE
jgi:hypothetical protein